MQNVRPVIDGQGWSAVSDTSKLNTGNYYPIEMKLNYSPGVFTLFIPRSHIMSTLSGFLLISVLVTVLSIFILFLIVELASYLITRRLSRLVDRVNMNIENTNTAYDSDRRSTEDDLGRMEDKIYDMLDKIREFYKSMLEHENEKKTFELELLQSRINPHFLYNTLSTMKWNCKNEKMADIIDSMVLYYRLALNKGDTIIKISHEMKLVEEYLKIQKYTYESDFIYIFDVDDDVMESLTIRHLLQPVVENALLHGINGLDSGGVIKLSGKLKDGIITLTVSDNGVGMPEETVQQLLYGEYKSKMGGYGIKNVQRRINLFYGPDFALNITSVLKKGTTIEIAVPAVYREKSYDSNNILV
jgi:sensor histidine kinase YesM